MTRCNNMFDSTEIQALSSEINCHDERRDLADSGNPGASLVLHQPTNITKALHCTKMSRENQQPRLYHSPQCLAS